MLNRMEIAFDFEGEIVERQELLNGTEMVTVQCGSIDGAWALTACISRNRGLVDHDPEGDITLRVLDGAAELWGSLVRTVEEASDLADWAVEAEFEVDGGTNVSEEARGRVTIRLEALSDSVRGHLESY